MLSVTIVRTFIRMRIFLHGWIFLSARLLMETRVVKSVDWVLSKVMWLTQFLYEVIMRNLMWMPMSIRAWLSKGARDIIETRIFMSAVRPSMGMRISLGMRGR